MYNKKGGEVSLLLKVMTILVFGFMLKLLISCRPKFPDPTEIYYNKIVFSGVDNSGRYLNYYNSTTDAVFAEAMAFTLIITDTSMFQAASFFPNLMQSFSFQALKADSYDPIYVPKYKVVSINIRTLFDINSSIKAGEDITQNILYAPRYRNGLYQNLSEGLVQLNGFQTYYEDNAIVLVLKSTIENSQAQFEVEVTLDNGDKLLSTSEVFTIMEL